MPGLVKIGYTETSVLQRLKELDTTGIPTIFREEFSLLVRDPVAVERAVHKRLSRQRVRKGREWFKISPTRAREVIEECAASLGYEVSDEVSRTRIEQEWLKRRERWYQAQLAKIHRAEMEDGKIVMMISHSLSRADFERIEPPPPSLRDRLASIDERIHDEEFARMKSNAQAEWDELMGKNPADSGPKIVRCPSCKQQNRVRLHPYKRTPKCGKCGAHLTA